MKQLSSRGLRRVALVGVAGCIVAYGLAMAQGPPNHANRIGAVFTETRLDILDRPDLGIRQVINQGSGTFDGFGTATEIVAVSQDRTVTPCGPGSDTSTIMRRIVVPEGVLVLKTLAHRCPTASGLVAIGQFEVDGVSSTGVFAGAWGSGTDTVQIGTTVTTTISGKLHLVQR
jgi:hypothetical protein